MARLMGRVCAGRGDFAGWLERFEHVYFEVTGVSLYHGTLNVELEEAYSLPSSALRIEPDQIGGRVAVLIVRCAINGRPAFLLRTDANEDGVGHHDRNIVEIAADVRLRDLFDLQDGDVVQLDLP